MRLVLINAPELIETVKVTTSRSAELRRNSAEP